MYLCLVSVRRVVTVMAYQRSGRVRPVRLLPGLKYVARCESDRQTFCVRGVGWFSPPDEDAGAFVVQHFSEMFVLFWRATPSSASVSRLLRSLGFRTWTPRRVRHFARWLKRKGVPLP